MFFVADKPASRKQQQLGFGRSTGRGKVVIFRQCDLQLMKLAAGTTGNWKLETASYNIAEDRRQINMFAI